MEPALKTRLLGAAVLIALAIIFVPMFFSGGAHKNTDDQAVSLKIPDQPDAQLKTTTLSVGPDSASANAGSNDPDRVATVDADAGKPAAPTQNVAVENSQPPAATTIARPAVPGKSPDKIAQAPPPKAAPAPAPATLPISSAPGTAAIATYTLNLGIYAARGNADKLIAKLGALGFTARGESTIFNGKPATRVVVGPYPDRAAAEVARLKLKSVAPGVPLALVAGSSDQTADAPANAVPANRAGGWAVQLGAFGTEADANKLRDRLRALGFDGFVDNVPSGTGKLWRVRAGPVNERASAEQLKSQIAAKMKISGMVVTST